MGETDCLRRALVDETTGADELVRDVVVLGGGAAGRTVAHEREKFLGSVALPVSYANVEGIVTDE